MARASSLGTGGGLTNVKALLEEEGDRIGKLLSGPKTAKQVRAIFSGHSYAEDDDE